MRIHNYRFPDGTPENVMLENGCGVQLKGGGVIYPDTIPDEHRDKVAGFTHISGCSISTAKKLLKQYGGTAWTDHFDRDGGFFESSPIVLKGNNSRVQYNRHL